MILKDKVAIVTGAAGGIGSAIVSGFKKEGAVVYGIDIAYEDDFGAGRLKVDVADTAAVKKAVSDIAEKEGRIDIIVNCAGYSVTAPLKESLTSDWDRTFAVNVRGPVIDRKSVV